MAHSTPGFLSLRPSLRRAAAGAFVAALAVVVPDALAAGHSLAKPCVGEGLVIYHSPLHVMAVGGGPKCDWLAQDCSGIVIYRVSR